MVPPDAEWDGVHSIDLPQYSDKMAGPCKLGNEILGSKESEVVLD